MLEVTFFKNSRLFLLHSLRGKHCSVLCVELFPKTECPQNRLPLLECSGLPSLPKHPGVLWGLTVMDNHPPNTTWHEHGIIVAYFHTSQHQPSGSPLGLVAAEG